MNPSPDDARRKSAQQKDFWFVMLALGGVFLVIGGCCALVMSTAPYNPNWRSDPKYDNYDTPVSPDNGGYGRPL